MGNSQDREPTTIFNCNNCQVLLFKSLDKYISFHEKYYSFSTDYLKIASFNNDDPMIRVENNNIICSTCNKLLGIEKGESVKMYKIYKKKLIVFDTNIDSDFESKSELNSDSETESNSESESDFNPESEPEYNSSSDIEDKSKQN